MEPVNFLQSTSLKINQEYAPCAKKVAMDLQDPMYLDSFERYSGKDSHDPADVAHGKEHIGTAAELPSLQHSDEINVNMETNIIGEDKHTPQAKTVDSDEELDHMLHILDSEIIVEEVNTNKISDIIEEEFLTEESILEDIDKTHKAVLKTENTSEQDITEDSIQEENTSNEIVETDGIILIDEFVNEETVEVKTTTAITDDNIPSAQENEVDELLQGWIQEDFEQDDGVDFLVTTNVQENNITTPNELDDHMSFDLDSDVINEEIVEDVLQSPSEEDTVLLEIDKEGIVPVANTPEGAERTIIDLTEGENCDNHSFLEDISHKVVDFVDNHSGDTQISSIAEMLGLDDDKLCEVKEILEHLISRVVAQSKCSVQHRVDEPIEELGIVDEIFKDKVLHELRVEDNQGDSLQSIIESFREKEVEVNNIEVIPEIEKELEKESCSRLYDSLQIIEEAESDANVTTINSTNSDVNAEVIVISVLEEILDKLAGIPVLERKHSPKDIKSSKEVVLPNLIPIPKLNRNELPMEMPSLEPISKHGRNNRVSMAKLIERKLLKSNPNLIVESPTLTTNKKMPELTKIKIKEETFENRAVNINSEAMLGKTEKCVPQFESTKNDSAEDKPKKPIIGCVRKSMRKRGRLTKPPWLINNDGQQNEDEEGDSDNVSEEGIEENVKEPSIEYPSVLTNGVDMREKLFSQLEMLKGKKKSHSLFDAKIPNLTETHYTKRTGKVSKSKSLTPYIAAPPGLGLRIVAVAGGVNLDRCKTLTSSDNLDSCLLKVNDKAGTTDNNPGKEVIINDHLNLPTIKLTKTKDYRKIKGWSKKKMLTLYESNPNLDITETIDGQKNDANVPSCSYLVRQSNSDMTIDIKGEKRTESGNVFASNSLDGFLQEKDLNISYNVPNLKSSNHNINLLDACMLVNVEHDNKRKESVELEDSNSCSSFKEQNDKEQTNASNVYKPRTLAEKRKMLSDEHDGIVTKRWKPDKPKQKKFSRRSFASRFESATSPVKLQVEASTATMITPSKVEDMIIEENEESLLVPIDPEKKTIVAKIDPGDDKITLLDEEESKPKDCVTSQIKCRMFSKIIACSVVTRRPINKTYIHKFTDIKRKASFDLVPKNSKAKRLKPSILKESPRVAVNYKPGPLCKKNELQMNGCKDWETVIVNLPKVNVEVTPKIGKKMDPVVRPFVRFDSFQVSKSRAEFALSTLTVPTRPTRRDTACIFQFPTHYNHRQEKFMMRKVIPKTDIKKKSKISAERVIRKPETSKDVLDACALVMDRMLDFVEMKEIEGTLLKYDSDAEITFDSDLDVTPPSVFEVKDGKEGSESLKRKLSYDRVSSELRRLNVRTVDLPNKEEHNAENEEKPLVCSESCKFGCICHSISSRYPSTIHCGESCCIFKCICGFEKCSASQSNYGSNNILSERILSRFNKEAKRNITAKEERDFTQTALRSRDNTIILGNNVLMGKRTPKYNFKRFEGFHFSFVDEVYRLSNLSVADPFSQRLLQADQKMNNCVVNLVRCDFDDIVPFCLVHNLYDCHCGGKAKYSHYDSRRIGQLQKAKFNPLPEIEEVLLPEKPPKQKSALRLSKAEQPKEVETSENRPAPQTNPVETSARLRGNGEIYRMRNKTNKFKNLMGRKLKYDKTANPEIVNSWVILTPECSAPRKKHEKTRQKLKKKDEPSDNSIIIVDDDYTVLQDNRRRQKKSNHRTLKALVTHLTIAGALYSPTSAISKQFSDMIGNGKESNSSEFRLLLWVSLIQLYEMNDIQIWLNNVSRQLKFIITDSLSTPKGSYTNIRQFEKSDHSGIKVDFIKWIVTKTMPENKKSNNILVILKVQELFWEICGICAKNAQNSLNQAPVAIPTMSKTAIPNEVIQTVDEKYYKTVQHVVFANGTFAPKKLILADPSEVTLAESPMDAALPHIISNCRWRVLKVNSNFAILAFSRNEFRIKCSDILTVMKVALKYEKTIIINTAEVSQNYQHKNFGIYIPPNYQDRIFIGPYLQDEEHGLKTFRFVNNELMNTEEFNKIRGIKNASTTGLWYLQFGRASESTPVATQKEKAESVIDLTDIDDVMNMMKTSDITITPSPNTMTSTSKKMLKEGVGRKSKQSKSRDSTMEKPPVLTPSDAPIHSQVGKTPHALIKSKKKESSAQGKETVMPILPKIPELIKLPLKANKLNKNITSTSAKDIKEVVDVADFDNMVSNVKNVDSNNLKKCFIARIKIVMKQMDIDIPNTGEPLCFRLNFGNGIILAYQSQRGEVCIYWPGDCQKQFYFQNISEASKWLIKELHEVFICIPSTFKIVVTPVGSSHYLEYLNRGVISQKYFKEICIIGDFGIMRLSEAQKYLIGFEKVADARRALLAADKSLKFKKAITQIIESNDMTKEEFRKRVRDLITKAKAAADTHPPSRSQPVNSVKMSQLTPPITTTAIASDEVICLDSDEDEPEYPVLSIPERKSVGNRSVLLPQQTTLLGKRKSLPLLRPKIKIPKRVIDDQNITRNDEVMQIDLRHLTTEKVKELLRGNEYGDNITLTHEQVKRLRALSRNNQQAKKFNGIS